MGFREKKCIYVVIVITNDVLQKYDIPYFYCNLIASVIIDVN